MTRYAFTVDADGQAIPEGQAVAEIKIFDGTEGGSMVFAVWPGVPFCGPDGFSYPANWLERSLAPERTDKGLFPVTEANPPAGKVQDDDQITVVNQRPVVTDSFEDAPAPPRRTIPKSIVMQRVDDAGMFDPVFGAFQAQPKAWIKWTSPDWPNVFFDDPLMLQVLSGVGCTDAQIEAITAPYPAPEA
jgi:hypothetical protein